MNGMSRLLQEMSTGDLYSLKRLFAFKGSVGTAPATVVDAAVGKIAGAKEALDALMARGAVVRKGGDYVWDWTQAKEEAVELDANMLSAVNFLAREIDSGKYWEDAVLPVAKKFSVDDEELMAAFKKKMGVAVDSYMQESSGMSRLSGLLEAFKYTGDWEKDFNDEHPLLIDVIIDTAVDRRLGPGSVHKQDMVRAMTKKFGDVYKANQSWAEKILNGRGNSGRDTLYAFINHWVDAALAKK